MTCDPAKAEWRKSTRSGNTGGQCVELALNHGSAAIRDSKNPSGPVLTFDQAELSGFLDAIKSDRFKGLRRER